MQLSLCKVVIELMTHLQLHLFMALTLALPNAL